MVGDAALYPLLVGYMVLAGWVAAAGLLAVRLFMWE
jgi:hypothetical protein